MLPVRNALNLRYTKSVKIQNAIDEVKEVVRWDDMPETGVGSKADLDIILREEAETDMGLRSGADPSKPRSTNLRQEDRIDAIEYMKREHESSPGSRKTS